MDLVFTSELGASAARVWRDVTTMRGVNDELAPLLRMSHPRRYATASIVDAPLETPLFSSWLLAFGWLPIDRHRLVLARMETGARFEERSTSWLQRRWDHTRTIASALRGGACVLTDEISFESRVAIAMPLTTAVVSRVFVHRHDRLRARYGK